LLLWIVILGLWTAAVAVFSQKLPDDFRTRMLSILGLISSGFLLLLVITSNPFYRLLPFLPTNGNDLNALLQDPGLAFHPPVLYMGYVGFAVPFAFAVTVLLSGKMSSEWAKWARPWTLLAWCFLTLGVTAGSWWSYRELGWGGWWFWDPVENASFMPWLAGIALIHSLIVSEKRNAFHHWTILLAILTFSLSLAGTFLVRSGILISVHAFAVNPERGIFLLAFLLMVIGSALSIYAFRAKILHSRISFSFVSRENFLLLNNVLLFVAVATILLGTLYPLIFEASGLGKISVGSPYFNSLFVPLTMLILFCMGIGPLCHWEKTAWHTLRQPLLISLVISAVFAFWISLPTALAVFAIMAIVHRAWLTRKSPMSANRLGMWLAHIGIGVCVIGIALSASRSVERNVRMGVNDTAAVGPYVFKLTAVGPVQGSNYTGNQGKFLITENNKIITYLYPESRLYTVQQVVMAKTAIDAGLFRDLYVAMAEPLDGNTWAVRLYDKPFIRWIWAGGVLIFLGGLCSASSRKFWR
jgi:cytochrome c-type biogenesis protein CcmF